MTEGVEVVNGMVLAGQWPSLAAWSAAHNPPDLSAQPSALLSFLLGG